MVSEPSLGRFGRLLARRSGFPTERDWERTGLLEPHLVPADPQLVSDGGGLPFAPGALDGPVGQLDPADGAVTALSAQLSRQKKPKKGSRGSDDPPPPARSLDEWRVLARADDEVLFGRGRPPQLVTVAVRREDRRRGWACVGVSAARPLRVTRDGIRASGWRLDPTHEPDPTETVLRVLVTEQTWAGGTRADERLLAPDLHVGADAFVLTMFVTPRGGFQTRSPNPETPARIALPGPIGERELIDGALYDPVSP